MKMMAVRREIGYMKIVDSGMPDEGTWEQFFDAERILAALAFDDSDADVVDFGCGYGAFTLATARMTAGNVYALDIEASMVEKTAARAARLGLENVIAIERDFVAHGSGLADESIDYAMLFNILHADEPLTLLGEAFRVLRPGGKVAVIHWIYDETTPRGPHLSIRPRPEDCRRWLDHARFEAIIRHVSLPPYHYGVVGRKPTPTAR
jgi:ubiquinone/menaquinone biosynthesis C-methylase UbiE